MVLGTVTRDQPRRTREQCHLRGSEMRHKHRHTGVFEGVQEVWCGVVWCSAEGALATVRAGLYGLFGWVHLGMVHRCLTTNSCRGADTVLAGVQQQARGAVRCGAVQCGCGCGCEV